MNIPRYWANSAQSVTAPNGRRYALSAWRWSDLSTEEARQQSIARLRELVQKVLASEQLNRYSYGDQPLREEISQAVTNRDGKQVAVITRNLYGALILNAENAMFIDIDFADDGDLRAMLNPLRGLFHTKAPNPEPEPLERIQNWWERNRDLSLRVYRTFAGMRCLVTNQVFDPGQSNTADILKALNSDPLYIRLCHAQKCFRARLTPKPWRCGMRKPPSRYPWSDAKAETQYRQWEQQYESVTTQYATCRLVKEFGIDQPHPDVAPILEFHDNLTRTESNLKLA